ncbi:6718_t:CDS:1 [Funneliformis geosporum]|uniref:6718_t:CDS:1 n=1 Tax=Funneliformis geosporum TaxID=1117311 RepID=A0A9W4WWF6_9GLOM|nr:6718_t:CDS:1 [Funneliformis geosporum]
MNRNEQKGWDILFPLETLEYYIEKLGVYPNFKKKQQLHNRITPELTLQKCSLVNTEDTFRTQLILFLGAVMDTKNPPQNNAEQRQENQEVFQQWLHNSGITASNCPTKLKHFLLEIKEILENQSDKIYHETTAYLWRKAKEKPTDPQKVAKVFKDIGGIMANTPKLYKVDMKGNAAEGKKILAEISSSLSAEERENFHFHPPFTNEEKAEYEKEQKEGKKSDPITKGQRINAIEEIKNAFQREPKRLTVNDLDPENQDWENEINRTEKIIEIENVKRRVLADIEKKKCAGCQKLKGQLLEKETQIKTLEQEIAELETKLSHEPSNDTYKANLTKKKSELSRVHEELKQLISPTPRQNHEINSSSSSPWP